MSKMMKIIDDPLLTNKTANNLILLKEPKKLFIHKDFLNIYAALVKVHYPYIIKRGPSLIGENLSNEVNKFLNSLPLEYKENNFIKLRKLITEYTGIKRFDRTLSFWIKKKRFPFVILRVFSLLKTKNKQNKYLAHLIKCADYFTSTNYTKFLPPLTLGELLNESILYLIGVTFGDGGVADNFKLFKITDGSQHKNELRYTRLFFRNLSKLIEDKFDIKSKIFKEFEEDNKYRMQFSNKWFNYYMNFFFGMPLGPKKNLLRKPLIINLSKNSKELSKIFWRGVFDTDGTVSNRISLEMSNKYLILECKKDLEKCEISPHYSERNKIVAGKFHKEYCITVNRYDYKTFARNIGINHPRKQLNFAKELLKTSRLKNSILDSREVEKLKSTWSSPFS